ncbi:MAG: porin [Rhodospirillales bacterium]
MKKILLATTALATAALVAGAAGDALAQETTSKAAERIKVGLGGYFQQWGVGASQDIKDGPGDITPIAGSHGNTIKQNAVDQKHNSEICFIGQTTLDNGLTVGLNVQLEANTEADTIDESYLFLQGPSLGQIILGDENNAGYLLHVTAPDGGVSLDSGDLVNIAAWINTGISSYFDTPVGTTNLRLTDNDSGKFTYITPRFAGLQAGVSFIPQTEGGGDDNNGAYFVRTPTGAGTEVSAARSKYSNGWAGGLNYTQQFGPVGAQASGGVMYFPRSKQSPVGGNGSDLFAYNLGLQMAFGGFSVGGAWMESPNRNTVQTTVTNLNGTVGQTATYSLGGYSWTVGAAYEFGPYKVGLGYMYGKSPGVIAATGPMATHLGDDQVLKQAIISGAWTMGPGIRLVGGVFAYDLQTDTPGVTGYNNEGVGATTGIKLAF